MPYSLVVEWAFSRDRDFQRGTGSVVSSSLYFGIAGYPQLCELEYSVALFYG